MKKIIENPLRVYLILGVMALLGLYSGWNLPISLFPNSSKITVRINIPLYSMTPSDFYKNYGYRVESQLRSIDLKINDFTADYNFNSVEYRINFDWSVNGDEALSKVKDSMSGLSASFPELMRKGYNVNKWSENRTFVALSFFSKTRSTDEIYSLLQPTLEPELLALKDVQNAFLYNPLEKEITVELIPEKIAKFGLSPSYIESILQKSVEEYQGGRIEYQDKRMQIFFDKQIKTKKDLENFSFYTSSNNVVFLKDISDIRLAS
ncbi:MAG: efflux RND transporter permease subunit, partial [Bdellovibrionales bacterium]|nr:efflux RND transporter permease subunit [Bdellovibrionales bacterium]